MTLGEGATDCRNRRLTVTANAKALRPGGPFPCAGYPTSPAWASRQPETERGPGRSWAPGEKRRDTALKLSPSATSL